jgi:hypothetical protein
MMCNIQITLIRVTNEQKYGRSGAATKPNVRDAGYAELFTKCLCTSLLPNKLLTTKETARIANSNPNFS